MTIETQDALGTGFLVQDNGTIVTNYHVVRGAEQIKITLQNGEVYKSAYLLRADEEKDIAILRIEAVDLPFLLLGNSSAAKVGEDVMAIGTPEGLEQTASTGIISGRRLMPLGYELIQTTAPISHGSSGGPLLNRSGKSIGIMTAFLAEGQNLNFAVPINYVRGILDSLALSPNGAPRLISANINPTNNGIPAAKTRAESPTPATPESVAPKMVPTPTPEEPKPAVTTTPGTNPIVDYMHQIKYDGLTLSILLVNDRTADLLFQEPTRQAMKERSHKETVLYIQGTPQRDFNLSTAFSLVQGTETLNGKATNFKNFVTGKAPAGQRIDGVVEFPKKIDISKPFTVRHGTAEVVFNLTEQAIKALP